MGCQNARFSIYQKSVCQHENTRDNVHCVVYRCSIIRICSISSAVLFYNERLRISFGNVKHIGNSGFMYWFYVIIGWQLGTIEGICITVCIGFSVDFVVHVAIAYIESKANSRYEKVRQALGEMGISVLGATLTTGVSSIFMIAAPMIPFSKIG